MKLLTNSLRLKPALTDALNELSIENAPTGAH